MSVLSVLAAKKPTKSVKMKFARSKKETEGRERSKQRARANELDESS